MPLATKVLPMRSTPLYTAGSLLMDLLDELNLCVLNDGRPTRRGTPTQNPSAVDLSIYSPFSSEELLLALNGLSDSSPGIDGIPYSFLIRAPDRAKLYFLNLLNIFFDQGTIPDVWKQQIVIPIPKPGKDPLDHNSYRPIALSSVLLKVMEHMIRNRLEWFVESQGILSKTQFGFRKGLSTLDSLSILTTDIRLAFKKKEYLVGVFLDIASAYDNVLLPVLRQKLLHLSVSEKLVRLIYSTLTSRSISVRYQDTLLPPRLIFKGLPQGSVLSPLLYSIYTYDLDRTVESFCNILQYADDIAIYVSSSSILEATCRLNSALQYLGDWLLTHGLSLSVSKCSCVTFTRKRLIPEIDISFDGEKIPRTNKVKFLGLILDSRLSGVPHFNYIIQKAEKGINVLRALSGAWWGAHPYSQKLLYNAIIRSHFDYASFLLDPCNKSALDKLTKTQSKCLRIILGAMKSSPINALQIECVDPPLYLRRQYLSDRFYVKAAQNSSHPLLEKLELLSSLSTSSDSSQNIPCILLSFLKFNRLPTPIEKVPLNPLFSNSFESLIFQPPIILNFGISKDSISARQEFYSILSEHWQGWLTMYTDASKLAEDGCVGAAVWIPVYKIALSLKCPPVSSVFTGESIAILEAILYAKSHSLNNCIIFTDSLSCLQTILANPFKSKTKFPIILKIREALFECKKNNINIVLAWIPSHRGIPGNETVDSCAKNAISTGSLEYFKLYSHDVSSLSRTHLFKSWNTHWNNTKKKVGRHYSEVQHTIPPRPWFFKYINLSKRIVSIICRLRIGHSCTPVHLAKLRIKDSSICECGLDEGSVKSTHRNNF
ncbi:hypothetical protein ABMA27_015319 [Loxostege sticticalis]|uniref:RNA-directed DNA polymerase from mobile element jockey n=1 Tax=Loxostege sticticalis TaxID=481309 RepID=A0ABR3I776_LOXSC